MKKLFTIICMLLPLTLWAQEGTAEPYAVLSEENTVLTFYYDDQKEVRGGMNVGTYTSEMDRPWRSGYQTVTQVVFDESFAGYEDVTSTAYWFYNFSKLVTINGLEYLNTTNISSMRSMFTRCSSLTSLEFGGMNMPVLKDIGFMFSGCSSLTSLNLSGFTFTEVTAMNYTFSGCSSLESIDLSGINTAKVTDMLYVQDIWKDRQL